MKNRIFYAVAALILSSVSVVQAESYISRDNDIDLYSDTEKLGIDDNLGQQIRSEVFARINAKFRELEERLGIDLPTLSEH